MNKKAKVKSPLKVNKSSKKTLDRKSAALKKSRKSSKSNTGRKSKTIAKKSQASKKKLTVRKSQITSHKTPKSMEELLEMAGHKIKGLKRGDVVDAVITDINRKAMFFDIGAKTEGILAEKEKEFIVDFTKQLKVGDKVKTRLISPENEKGQILLSLKKAAHDWTWNLFEEYLKSGQAVEVRGLDITRGGITARFMGVRGFVPTSQFSRQYLGKLRTLYNRLFEVKVIEVDRKKNRLIFSEKEVSEAEAIKAQKKALSKIKVGEVYKGVVSGIMLFGLFVRVDVSSHQPPATSHQQNKKKKAGSGKLETGSKKSSYFELFLEGLVHISEISWEKVENLPRLYKVGQKIDVKIIGVEKNTGRLTLSIKRLQSDPWEELAKRYKKDSKIKGKVTRLVAFGAFVELGTGIEGLIHISKIPADMSIKVGDEIKVYIESLDIGQRRISLGLVLKEKPVGYK